MRGNPFANKNIHPTCGSIPARAGEPSRNGASLRDFGVYPRACGGTHTPRLCRAAISGLSPRVRGNPTALLPVIAPSGSIPARAGEPMSGTLLPSAGPVYPRACGGTLTPRNRAQYEHGLSPRVRGNRDGIMLDDGVAGSIPARAGEPLPD